MQQQRDGGDGEFARSTIRYAAPRQTVLAYLHDRRILEGPVGTSLEAFVAHISQPDEPPIVAALVDGQLCELTCSLVKDAHVRFLSNATSDGQRIYQRSLTLLMLAAVRELHPEARITVDHAVTMAGLLCQVRGRPPFTESEIEQIEALMRLIVEQDEPIVKRQTPLDQAIALFQERGYDDKVRLLRFRKRDFVVIYSLRQEQDYFYGYMVPSAGYLPYFDLMPHPLGFILRAPPRGHPIELPQQRESPKLDLVFRRYGEWLSKLDIDDVGSLNETIESGRIREVILLSEALHEQQVVDIAAQIAARRDQIRLVLIAGPSSSGKTTSSKRLAIQLMARGLRPVPLQMDDYFVDRSRTPLDENGEYDFEHLHALDLDRFNHDIVALLRGQRVQLPHYDFQTGTTRPGSELQIGPQQIIIAEGIHGINPELVQDVPPESIFRLYISAITQLNIDDHNRVSTTDTRLIRRLVRDAQYRGYPAAGTIDRWESVRRGETRWIFPYQENADAMFNSALVYELAVLKPYAEPLLRQVEPGTLTHIESKRLLAFLQWFRPCSPDMVPDNSILREFVGGSILRDFDVSLGDNK